MRHTVWISCFLLAAAIAVFGCRDDGNYLPAAQSKAVASDPARLTVPTGTSIDVTLDTHLTSKTAGVGDAWTGSVKSSPAFDGRTAIPVGSVVSGTVTGARPARRGDRAMLDLGLNSITIGSRQYTVHGTTEAIIAGSPRARNLGAIAGSAAGGALIGKVVSGSNKGALIGGLIGAGAATGVVAASDGYQVVLKSGTALTFTTSEILAVRY